MDGQHLVCKLRRVTSVLELELDRFDRLEDETGEDGEDGKEDEEDDEDEKAEKYEKDEGGMDDEDDWVDEDHDHGKGYSEDISSTSGLCWLCMSQPHPLFLCFPHLLPPLLLFSSHPLLPCPSALPPRVVFGIDSPFSLRLPLPPPSLPLSLLPFHILLCVFNALSHAFLPFPLVLLHLLVTLFQRLPALLLLLLPFFLQGPVIVPTSVLPIGTQPKPDLAYKKPEHPHTGHSDPGVLGKEELVAAGAVVAVAETVDKEEQEEEEEEQAAVIVLVVEEQAAAAAGRAAERRGFFIPHHSIFALIQGRSLWSHRDEYVAQQLALPRRLGVSVMGTSIVRKVTRRRLAWFCRMCRSAAGCSTGGTRGFVLSLQLLEKAPLCAIAHGEEEGTATSEQRGEPGAKTHWRSLAIGAVTCPRRAVANSQRQPPLHPSQMTYIHCPIRVRYGRFHEVLGVTGLREETSTSGKYRSWFDRRAARAIVQS
ncbi:hypothetical protein BDZ91DRAFT_827225 [Kalaharituber pfeilii]|nr:hypothetical protein BDZ91DRAFT_827225 [Kalaharituber pfeilii]